MPAQTYDIFFSGRILDGASPDEVKARIGKLFNTSGDQLEQLFSGEQLKIKNGVDQETAIKYRVAFRNAGALVEIRTADARAGEPEGNKETRPAEAAADQGMVLLPPKTGSLIDCAPRVEPAPLPDISDLSLASPGAVLDETPEPPAADIDTSQFQLTPANSGTLEDCQTPKEPAPLPDISRLKLVE